MNHPSAQQASSPHATHAVPLPQRVYITWQKRLSFIALLLGCLLLINAALFTRIAHATPTPEPPDTPTSAPTSPSLPVVAAPPATNTPSPTATPPPQRSALAQPQGLGLPTLAFGSLLLIGMVFVVRIPVAKARRRAEHDE